MCQYFNKNVKSDECSHDATPWVWCRYPLNVFDIINALIAQLGTSCVFDSPGLARNEPTPGEHPQGDSTP